jgi:hypothetical protein
MRAKMESEFYLNKTKRVTLILGHYGSGKSEFAINYAVYLAKHLKKISLIDLDIASPYFRSREKLKLLNDNKIETIFNTYGFDINLDLPAISASMFGAIEDKSKTIIIDCGGDRLGAKVVLQIKRFLPVDSELEILCVINANRNETNTFEGAKYHIREIEEEIGLKITGIVNNTHMLLATTLDDIYYGEQICKEIEFEMNIKHKITCIEENLLKEISKKDNEKQNISNFFPIHLYLRESWLDL